MSEPRADVGSISPRFRVYLGLVKNGWCDLCIIPVPNEGNYGSLLKAGVMFLPYRRSKETGIVIQYIHRRQMSTGDLRVRMQKLGRRSGSQFWKSERRLEQ